MDITEVILTEHGEQRRFFAMIEDTHKAGNKVLNATWKQLSDILEVHAKAEELFFYPHLLTLKEHVGSTDLPDSETLDAIKDHNEIRDAIKEVAKHTTGSRGWWKAMAGVNKANGDHMAEEEREGLTSFRLNVELDLRHEIAVQFLEFQAKHIDGIKPEDVDPQQYVNKNS